MENFKRRFKELKIIGDRSKMPKDTKQKNDIMLIQYLKDAIKNKSVTDFEDIGFCYFNISDNYGLLKDGYKLCENHKCFNDFLTQRNTEYLFWLCCDATQRFTLEKDGYSEFWWNIYKNAVEQNKDKNTVAEFYVHRAALSESPIMPHNRENLEYTINAINRFLEKQRHCNDYDFYKDFFCVMQSLFTKGTAGIVEICIPYLSKLKLIETQNKFLCGEWQGFAQPICENRQANLIVNTAINSLAYRNEKTEAKKLYELALQYGMQKNSYIERRI